MLHRIKHGHILPNIKKIQSIISSSTRADEDFIHPVLLCKKKKGKRLKGSGFKDLIMGQSRSDKGKEYLTLGSLSWSLEPCSLVWPTVEVLLSYEPAHT